MGINVNPPPSMKIPRQWQSRPEIVGYYKSFDRMMLQLWERTGGPEDLVDNTIQAITSSSSRISRNAAKINALEKVAFDVEMITEDFTTNRNQIIICQNTSLIEVTLDPQAVVEDTVHIQRTDKAVNVVGTIDGFTNKMINVQYFSLHLVFNGTDWSQI